MGVCESAITDWHIRYLDFFDRPWSVSRKSLEGGDQNTRERCQTRSLHLIKTRNENAMRNKEARRNSFEGTIRTRLATTRCQDQRRHPAEELDLDGRMDDREGAIDDPNLRVRVDVEPDSSGDAR